ncbi:MAG: response regulator [Lachnospiraceae bacterium]|nr:response regulator [Lachnospiraceae bacterium]
MKYMETRQTILVVDDTQFNRELLSEILGDRYRILEAANGAEALTLLEERGKGIALVLLDIVLPELDGFGVLEEMNKRGWIESIPVIMISSESGEDFVDRAYSYGVIDFIGRPFDTSIVRRRAANTIMLYARQHRLEEMVSEEIEKRERSNQLMISLLGQIVEFRNGESGPHIEHIRHITKLLLRQWNLRHDNAFTEEDISRISVASAVHDIGKMTTPEEILNKPGRLTEEEYRIMKDHAAAGGDMIKKLMERYQDPLLETAYEICRWHHERFDGRGYPDGLKGDEIPVCAQVVSIADVYDALTSERCYKKAFDHQTAMEMIAEGKCGVFNEVLLDCLREIGEELKRMLESGY